MASQIPMELSPAGASNKAYLIIDKDTGELYKGMSGPHSGTS